MRTVEIEDDTVQLIRRAIAAGVRQYTIANTLGITTRTLRRWREGECVPRVDAYRKLLGLVAVMERRKTMVEKLDVKLGIANGKDADEPIEAKPARPVAGRRSAKYDRRSDGKKRKHRTA